MIVRENLHNLLESWTRQDPTNTRGGVFSSVISDVVLGAESQFQC